MLKEEFNLWHYTTLAGLKGILLDKNLWATDYRYLNDSSELVYSKNFLYQELLPRVVGIIKKECAGNLKAQEIVDREGGIDKLSETETKETLEILYNSFINSPTLITLPCVLSFCKKLKMDKTLQADGLLSQWRAYGKDGGYALIFNKEKLCEEFVKDQQIFFHHSVSGHGDVSYELKDSARSSEIIASLNKVVAFAEKVYKVRMYGTKKEMIETDEFEAFMNVMMFIKHGGFCEEKEYRFYIVPLLEQNKETEGLIRDDKKKFKKLFFRETSQGLAPYITLFEKGEQLPIESICIGPHKDKELRVDSIKTFLRTIGQSHIKVYSSQIPFIG